MNNKRWRPITFNGVMFPPTLMGISVLDSILPVADEELCGWFHSIRHCCGVTKRASSEMCRLCADRALDLMLEHRAMVLAGIADSLGPHDFDPDLTYADWISAMLRISKLSTEAGEVCEWSAPGYESDPLGTPEKCRRLLDGLNKYNLGGNESPQ